MNDQETRTTIEDLLGPLNEVERKNAPKELFFAGDLSILDAGPRVSIVGSRKASGSWLEQRSRLGGMARSPQGSRREWSC